MILSQRMILNMLGKMIDPKTALFIASSSLKQFKMVQKSQLGN